uniref:Dynein regulatory complex protein 12 n=1 Tax=Callorhinchus milii TaxID=7868 RepID=A0A4W3J312_CALMI
PDPTVQRLGTSSRRDNIEDKYKRIVHEVESLKDQLVLRRDVARQALLCRTEWKTKLEMVEHKLSEEREDSKAIHSDIGRQYKTMRAELGVRAHQLEIEVSYLQQQLRICQQELVRTRDENMRIMDEKNAVISELQDKINNMETAYENILHDSLDRLLLKLDAAKMQWEKQATIFHSQHKKQLLEFGLNPLEI